MLRPGMITSWWTREIARAMQQFYEDLIVGSLGFSIRQFVTVGRSS
jgi:hypothetical protein